MANLKPILEELKSLKESINSDSIRELVLSNLQENREKIESRIKNIADSAKDNPVVNEYLDQVLKAELTNQAVSKLQASFPEHELVRKIVELRESLIEPTKEEASTEAPVTENTEPLPGEETELKASVAEVADTKLEVEEKPATEVIVEKEVETKEETSEKA